MVDPAFFNPTHPPSEEVLRDELGDAWNPFLLLRESLPAANLFFEWRFNGPKAGWIPFVGSGLTTVAVVLPAHPLKGTVGIHDSLAAFISFEPREGQQGTAALERARVLFSSTPSVDAYRLVVGLLMSTEDRAVFFALIDAKLRAIRSLVFRPNAHGPPPLTALNPDAIRDCIALGFRDLHDLQVSGGRAAPTDRQLEALSQRVGLPLPADYRAFVAAINGGEPRLDTYFSHEESEEHEEHESKCDFARFLGVGSAEQEGLLEVFGPGVIPLASGGAGAVLYRHDGTRWGVVFRWRMTGNEHPVTDSLVSFINNLAEYEI